MKEYFIFDVKNEFIRLYLDRPSELFYILNRIYYMKEVDALYGYNLFEQISNFFDKRKINDFITKKYMDKIMYSKCDNEHIINNLFLGEISILKVKSSNLRLETNVDIPMFFEALKDYSSNLFVCNFKTGEYFFLKKMKKVKKINS